MIKNVTLNEVIDLSIAAVQNYGGESEEGKKQTASVIRHLESMRRFEMNLSVLSLAIMNIRGLAQDGCRKDATVQDQIDSLKKIESMADRLHNVPGFMLGGVECDALYLYRNGIDENWPTGLIAGLGCISSVFHPNPSATLQNYEGLSLTAEEFQKIKDI